MHHLNAPLKSLLIIVGTSLLVAAICFWLGGFLAEIEGAPSWAPATIRVGGSLAGFLIVFFAMLHGYSRLGQSPLILKVALVSAPRISRTHAPKTVSYCVLNQTTGTRSTTPGDIFWEAGGPAIHLRDIEQDDLVMISVIMTDDSKMETDYFSPLNHSVALQEAK